MKPITAPKILDLGAVRGDPVPVKLPSGREVNVVPIDGNTRLELKRLRETPDDQLTGDEMWALAARLMPDATSEEIEMLTAAQVGAVLRIASVGIEEAQRMIDEGKGADPAAGSAPSLPMPTGTPSPASPAPAIEASPPS